RFSPIPGAVPEDASNPGHSITRYNRRIENSHGGAGSVSVRPCRRRRDQCCTLLPSMHIGFWIVFNAAILFLLFLDLAVLNRGHRVIPFKNALLMSAFWISLALGFAVFIHQWMGPAKALEFVAGYLLEEALSVDNLFVFILLFAYFKVPPEEEKTVLFWGILGALVMRGLFIFAGVALVRRFHWVLYAFGVFLIYTGIQLMFGGDKERDPSRNIVLRFSRRFLPLTDDYHGGNFVVRHNGKLLFTPL